MLKLLYLFLVLITVHTAKAQDKIFTKQDTLRGSITPERGWWDLTYYHLDISVDPATKSIKGKNTVNYKVLQPYSVLQIDLQAPLKITKVIQNGEVLIVKNEGNAHFISLKSAQKKGSSQSLEVYYEGKPQEAINAPWDGGFSWKKDENGNDFVATSCQGLGASIWWPNKDHMYDEVDSMLISVTVPKALMEVSNGQLRSIKNNNNGTKTYNWFVNNPINNYGVNVNIGDYVHYSEDYNGEKDILKMDYYVLKNNLEKAKKQFKEAPRMMEAFEHWFGPYPFYEDGYKLVEVPYLGMEHQSSVTYGNQFENGYLGRDVSGTGWGLKFDFIIIHESAHEWFANNITYKDIADMWIHESFTSYAESIFVEYFYGKEASAEYVIGVRKNIQNDAPIIGPYHVNQSGSVDMYYKGSNMLHTLRQWINDDEKWRQILRGLNETFYHQTVSTKQIEDYISETSGLDLTAFFNQYLRDSRVPTLEFSVKDNLLTYRWTQSVDGFDMPIRIKIGDTYEWISPTLELKSLAIKDQGITIDPNFYIRINRI